MKVFRCSSFSKMLPRCGRAAHICEANKTVWELQQKSKRELEESQLRFPGKLGMCPSLAEPDSVGISKSNSRRVLHETRHESESFSMQTASNEPQAN